MRAVRPLFPGGKRVTYTFDDAGHRITGVHHHTSGAQLLQSLLYSYGSGQVVVTESNGDVVTWTYDDALRLTREQRSGTNAYDVTYAYDAASNRTTKLTGGVTTSYTYNNAGALTVANTGGTLTTYSWDDAGNNTVVNANGSLTTLAWDDQNRLQVLELPSGGRVTQTYDHEGRRRQREDANGTVKFVWDGKQLLAELDSGGNTLARYTAHPSGAGVPAGETYGPIVSQRRGATSSFYLPDALGSVLRLAGANEAVTDSYVLDAWGAQIAASGSTTNPFRYVGSLGYYAESALSLDYVRSRWLRPGTGSWLSIDPVLDQPPYTYAGQRPMFVVDPSGKVWLLLILFGVVVYVGICVHQRLDEARAELTAVWKDHNEHPFYAVRGTDVHTLGYCRSVDACGILSVGSWIYWASELMEYILDLLGFAEHSIEAVDVASNMCGANVGLQLQRGIKGTCSGCCWLTEAAYLGAGKWRIVFRAQTRCQLPGYRPKRHKTDPDYVPYQCERDVGAYAFSP